MTITPDGIRNANFSKKKVPKGVYPNLTQAEGMSLGTAAKVFTIAGPVIVYGLRASVIYGIIYDAYTLIKNGTVKLHGAISFFATDQSTG